MSSQLARVFSIIATAHPLNSCTHWLLASNRVLYAASCWSVMECNTSRTRSIMRPVVKHAALRQSSLLPWYNKCQFWRREAQLRSSAWQPANFPKARYYLNMIVTHHFELRRHCRQELDQRLSGWPHVTPSWHGSVIDIGISLQMR